MGMLVAFASDDGERIAPHLSKATAFLLYDLTWPAPVEDGAPRGRTSRGRRAAAERGPSQASEILFVGVRQAERPKPDPRRQGCGGHSEGESVHHASVLAALDHVDALVCCRLGLGLLRDLEFLGVAVYPSSVDTVAEALELLTREGLEADYSRVCRCGR